MFDQTNQTGQTTGAADGQAELPEKLFEEETAPEAAKEDAEEHKEAGKSQLPNTEKADGGKPEAGQKSSPESKTPETVRIKFNGEEKDYPVDKAAELIQKGMNYDHVKAERDTKYKRELDILDRFAQQNHMSREKYLSYLESQSGTAAPDAQGGAENPALQAAQQKAKQNFDKSVSGWNTLFDAYPGLSVSEIPAEVFSKIANGGDPILTYQQHLIDDLQKRVSAGEKQADNKRRAVGSVRGDAAEVLRDPFLEGFGA